MPVIMEEKVERDFMITHPDFIRRGCVLFIGLLFLASSFQSCKPDLSDDPIPYQPFDDIVINLTLPAYINLATDGGYITLNSGGVRGIILYRKSSSTYLAFERNCSLQPNDACATVDPQIFDMKDSCCGSIFSYSTGQPTSGPAWRPLNQYRTTLSSNTLTITDEIVE
jgi:hypothetical protein